ncbi:MAG: RNA 2',3'-cyclic phosphodiesterase [Streptosporangiales bacterium]
MRLFVAVGVPEAVAADLDGAVAPLRAAWPALRWTGRDAWHLTLAFLGEMPDGATSRLLPRLERAAARHPLMSLSLGGSGAFPASPRARVFWTGVQGEQSALSTLAASVAAGARRAGAPGVEENRRYQPHLTLARCRDPVDARDLVAGLAGYAGPIWDAGQIHLIRSHLPGGRPQERPRYETLGSWPLRVPAADTGDQ